MRRFYKPYPKEFYAINDLLPEYFSENQPHLIINTIDYTNRCFNYNAIDPDRKRFSDEIYRNVINYLKDDKNLVLRYINKFFPEQQQKQYKAVVERFIQKDPGSPAYGDKVELHYHLVDLYHSFPNNPGKHLDGILKKIEARLAKMDLRFRYVIIDLIFPENYTHGELPWAKMRFYGYDDVDKPIAIPLDHPGKTSEEIIANQEDLRILEGYPNQSSNNKKLMTGNRDVKKQKEVRDSSSVFFDYLYPLFFDPKFDGKEKREGVTKFPFWSFIVFPIYSAELAAEGCYGTIIGHLYLSFPNEEERFEYLEGTEGKPDTSWDTLTILILRTLLEGRSHALVEADSQSSDSLKDLLSNIGNIQDWERVMVFTSPMDTEPELCFKRFPGQAKDRAEHEQVWTICEKEKACKECNKGFYDKLLNALSAQPREAFHFKEDDKCFFIQRLGKLLDPTILPSIEARDIDKYKQYVLIFEFPNNTFYPQTLNSMYEAPVQLGEHYVKKLIPIFDRILIKRKVLKHGFRSAATGIMARNLSHNISSHVLSYWIHRLSKEIKNGMPKDYIKTPEYTSNLLAYLKQRMDFIAEITTTLPSWEKTFLLRKDIIKPFTDQQFAIIDNIAKSEGFCSSSESCGKMQQGYSKKISCKDCERIPEDLHGAEYKKDSEPEALKIDVMNGDDYPVAVPQGTVGKQAFYSILENFIRNSAKHGGGSIRKTIKKGRTENNKNTKESLLFTIKADEVSAYPEFIKVTLFDNIGNCNHVIDLKSKKRVIDILNEAISDDKYIDDMGRIKRSNWGIKEMKLCANFLRKRDVSELFEGELDREKEPPLLSLPCYEKNCKKNKKCTRPNDSNLTLSFYFRKPREVCIVTNNYNDTILPNKKYGIDVLKESQLWKAMSIGETVPHRFLIFSSVNLSAKLIHEYREQLPMRIMFSDDSSQYTEPSEIDTPLWKKPVYNMINFTEIDRNPKKFISHVYEKFLEGKQTAKYKIVIRYKKGKAKSWKKNGVCTFYEDCKSDEIILDEHHSLIIQGNCSVSNLHYYQGVFGNTSFGKVVENGPPSVEDRDIVLCEWREAFSIGILVADERIWKNCQGKVANVNMSKRDLLKLMRIYLVPIHGEVIAQSNLKSILEDKEFQDVAFFVIHQGIIDKLKDKEFLEKILSKFPYVIVTSGRGKPKQLTQGTRYIPIGGIEEFIIEMDKYALVQSLFSLRGIHNDK